MDIKMWVSCMRCHFPFLHTGQRVWICRVRVLTVAFTKHVTLALVPLTGFEDLGALSLGAPVLWCIDRSRAASLG